MCALMHRPDAERISLRHGQCGVALPLVAAGLLAILAIAGLAFDSSHALANKTRLQNSVDAAALAAAKVLSLPSDTTEATAAAMSLLAQNADGPGNHEFNDAYDAGEITVTVQYSETSNPFTPGALNGPYVRVIAQNFNIQTTLSKVLGINEIPVAASAVAGPSPTIETCEVAPLVVCADDLSEKYFGFEQNELRVLKNRPGDHEDVGPGNFKLLRIDCDSGGGGACVRENMAGGVNICDDDDDGTVETEPGVTQGPTAQGFNTRFGIYQGGGVNPEDYPPDVVVRTSSWPLESGPKNSPDEDKIFYNGVDVQTADQIDFPFGGINEQGTYVYESFNGPHEYPEGSKGRRVMALPVANCTGDDNGQSTLKVEGFACYFMLQPIEGGGESGMEIFGQFVDGCLSSGNPGPDPNDAQGPFRIQLYKDPDSNDS